MKYLVSTMKALLVLLFLVGRPAAADSRAHYLANEGVLIAHGDTKILFDPLFDASFGQYQLMPAQMQRDLFAGEPPFDGVQAVFVSHHHGDHFSPELMMTLLKARENMQLYAPAQAVSALRNVAGPDDDAIFDRVTGLALNRGDAPAKLVMGDLTIEAVRIPHSGWPQRMTDIENIAFRITLNDDLTVLHLGDADPNPEHFKNDSAYWADRDATLALPPYWFFVSNGGRITLDRYIKAGHSVGVHVPVAIPDDPAERPDELQGFDLFTEPGETRELKSRD